MHLVAPIVATAVATAVVSAVAPPVATAFTAYPDDNDTAAASACQAGSESNVLVPLQLCAATCVY